MSLVIDSNWMVSGRYAGWAQLNTPYRLAVGLVVKFLPL